MSKLFKLIFNKYYIEVYMKGYRSGLSAGLKQGIKLAPNQPAVVGTESKIQREIEEIIKSKNF